MKNKIFLSVLLVAFVAGQVQSQTVRRVSNALGAGAPYTTIQDALTAAVDGDIILVEGSPTSYTGAISITKRVTIQGPGYFLEQNTGLQTNPYLADITGTISFNTGSSGSIVRGLYTRTVNINASNITFANNYVGGSNINITSAVSNIIISGNYFINGNLLVNANVTSLLVSNNYIGGISFSISYTILGVVSNNVISGGGYAIPNSTVVNNIFITATTNIISVTTNSTIQNNVFVAASQADADGTNVFGATVAGLFVGLTGNTTDTQWKLKTGSPAIGAGVGGTDCGMYGGNTPYRISGIFAGQPTISNFTTPGTVPANGTLNVKVSAKVN